MWKKIRVGTEQDTQIMWWTQRDCTKRREDLSELFKEEEIIVKISREKQITVL